MNNKYVVHYPDELKIRLFNPERKKITPLSELPNPDVVISERNELKSWHYLCMRLNLILSQYKTTIEVNILLLTHFKYSSPN